MSGNSWCMHALVLGLILYAMHYLPEAVKQFQEILVFQCTTHVVIDSTSCSSLFASYLADPETSTSALLTSLATMTSHTPTSPVLVVSASTTISGVISETEGPRLAPTGLPVSVIAMIAAGVPLTGCGLQSNLKVNDNKLQCSGHLCDVCSGDCCYRDTYLQEKR